MKKILIAGANSYIGDMFKEYVLSGYDGYEIKALDLMDESWRKYDFSEYDVVFHVAGIAHLKETKDNADLYYKVNRDLAYEVAVKAKESGVSQFIYLSSMSVYGIENGIVDSETVPVPRTNYGKSKIEGENKINQLKSNKFKIVILRPPMVYGKNCKGNFNALVKIAGMTRIFPKISNERSMIYIFNLCEFVKLVIDNECDGLFFPQNKEYVDTKSTIKIIANAMNRKMYFSILAGIAIRLLMPISSKCRKAFGSLKYQQPDMWDYSYCKTEFEKSIKESL